VTCVIRKHKSYIPLVCTVPPSSPSKQAEQKVLACGLGWDSWAPHARIWKGPPQTYPNSLHEKQSCCAVLCCLPCRQRPRQWFAMAGCSRCLLRNLCLATLWSWQVSVLFFCVQPLILNQFRHWFNIRCSGADADCLQCLKGIVFSSAPLSVARALPCCAVLQLATRCLPTAAWCS
jgi:hypothetical protein